MNLGPVGPSEPILVTIGNKRSIAFYLPDSGQCSISAAVFDAAPCEAPYSSARVRLSLWPGRIVSPAVSQKSIDRSCGDNASSLALSGPAELINASTTTNAR